MRPWLEAERHASVLAVPKTHRVWLGARQETAQVALGRRPADAWVRCSAGEGSQGPRWYDWSWLLLPGTSPAGWARWLLARRSVSDPSEFADYRVFAPTQTPLETVVRAAGRRWAIEESFEQAKGEVGLDQYEVRRWEAWHRHITLALLAHAYLEVTRLAATATAPATSGKGGALPPTCSR